MFENYPDVIEIKDVSQMLNISYTTVQNRIIKEKAIPYRKIGRNYKFRKIDVIRFFENSNEGETK